MNTNQLSAIFILAALSFSVYAENAANVIKPAAKPAATYKVVPKLVPVATQPVVKKPLQMAPTLADATTIRVLLLP